MVNLIHALTQQSSAHQFTVFGTSANRHLFPLPESRFQFVALPTLSQRVLPRIFVEQFVLPAEVMRRKIKVLHYGGTSASFLIRSSDVVTVHHDSVTQRPSMSSIRNLYFDVVLRLDRRAGRLIVPSRVYAAQMIEYYGYDPDKVRPIHHGVHAAFVPQAASAIVDAQRRWGLGDKVILSVTNTLAHKNLRSLVAAFHRLLTHLGTEAQLVLVGNINSSLLEAMIKELDPVGEELRQGIRLIPFLPQEQLPPIYGAATLFAFLSLTETFGMPLTEAMACGVPIVASDIPIHREILHGAGAMVDPVNVEEIAAVFHRLLTDPAARAELKRAASNRGLCFSWQETARQTLAVYEEAGLTG
jgi:glycosyltransferase involved in cell wall biosynthesis